MSIIWNVFIYYITNGNLQKVTEFVENNQVDASAQNNKAIIWAAYNGHLAVVEYLSTLPGVDASAQDNRAIINAASNGHLATVKYLSKLPKVDASAQDNKAIIFAASNGNRAVVKYLLTLPNVNAYAQDNKAIIWAAQHQYLSIVAILIYFKPKVALSLSDKKRYSKYSNSLLRKIRPVVHKITVALVELPTPILIEIIEQTIKFATYMQYHIKWNMVVAIKHSKYYKNNN